MDRRAFVIGVVAGAVLALWTLPATPGALMASVSSAVRPASGAATHALKRAARLAAHACTTRAASMPAQPIRCVIHPRPTLAVATAPVTPSFAWPVAGSVSSCYGERWGRIHVGVDVAAADGEPVCAARAGRVVWAGAMPGYGNMILLEHEDGWYTVYGHNQRHLVEATGDGRALVRAGQVIALVGRTGNATGPHVHFEVRKGIDAVDPLTVLPPRILTAAR